MIKIIGKSFPLLLLAIAAVWNVRMFGNFVVYSFIPLLLFGMAVIAVSKKIPEKWLVAALVLFALFLQIRNHFLFEPNVLIDSQWFLMWGRTFAEGQGFPGMWYRPPLYPFFLGLNFLITPDLHQIVILQRLMMVIAVPMLYILSKEWGFDRPVAATASLLFTMNSLIMQMSRSILVESLFIFLLLVTLLVFTRYFKKPSWQGAVATGVMFAVTAHCRQIASPLLFMGLVIYFVQNKKNRGSFSLVALAVFLACGAPWSLRNYRLHGGYGLSYNLGPNIFTKLTSFKLQDDQGRRFLENKTVLENVEHDLGITGYTVPEHPEDDWTVNRIPHVFTDSLVKNHGFSYSRATELQVAISVEGFLRHPARYCVSVTETMNALLFEHHETVPSIADVFPFSENLPYWMRAVLRSFVALHAFFFLLFAGILVWKKEVPYSGRWLPLAMVGYGYLSVAMIQVGFSRYTIPWAPFAALCAAYAVISPAAYVMKMTIDLHKRSAENQSPDTINKI